MKKVLLLASFVLAISAMMYAQAAKSTVDVLGAHNNQGRGCAGCHAPHSGAFGSGNRTATSAADATSGNYALWGQDATPLYGQTLNFGGGTYSITLASAVTNTKEVSGILLCLSCHDGDLTQTNMMTNQSYEQKIGLLPAVYGSTPIPTLLGNDGTTLGNYENDHPVGPSATISYGSGLVWTGSAFTVTAGTPAAQFAANYGFPTLLPGAHGSAVAVNPNGLPEVVCTTCHNQHVMTIYTSSAANQIANDGGGEYYATFFFVNAPYNPAAGVSATGTQANSTTQFCRQCHFGESNEANNTNTITTKF